MALADIGVYGLGTMGSALTLNLAEKGFDVAVSNREPEWIPDFVDEAGVLAERVVGCESLEAFVAALKPPRLVLFSIPSGAPVDQMIAQVAPLLEAGTRSSMLGTRTSTTLDAALPSWRREVCILLAWASRAVKKVRGMGRA